MVPFGCCPILVWHCRFRVGLGACIEPARLARCLGVVRWPLVRVIAYVPVDVYTVCDWVVCGRLGLSMCWLMVSGVCGFGLGAFPGPLPMSLRAWAVTVCVIGLRLWGAFAVLVCVAIWSRACGALGLGPFLDLSP